jgi:4-hydroxy-tetrahydrodipicolinate reductase
MAWGIDSLAKENGVTVLACGVNPGSAMDPLPLFVTGVCARVHHTTVRRVVDASTSGCLGAPKAPTIPS